MQFLSAYLLAAVAVDDGHYTDDYGIDENDDFSDFMEEGGDEIIGDYVELDVPTGGSGDGQNFSGNQFCEDWYAAFVRPYEYVNIYNKKKGFELIYPNVNKPEQWTGFVNGTGSKMIPVKLDELVNDETGKHINMWFASIGLKQSGQSGQGDTALGMTGVYLPSGVTFEIRNNYPTMGYATFSLSYKHGNLFVPAFSSNYNWQQRNYNGSGFTSSYYMNFKPSYILVYNVEVFKSYLNRLDASAIYDLLHQRLFALAECNIKKDWRKEETPAQTDWSDNDDYHGE